MSRSVLKENDLIRAYTETEMIQAILLIMKASNGGFSIQWLESVSLEKFFNLLDQCVKLAPTA